MPIAFRVDHVLDVTARAGGGFDVSARRLEIPYVKDYDAVDGEGPLHWTRRFDVSNWTLFTARVAGRRVGGATVAFNTPGLTLLEGRRDLSVLWDIRVAPDARGKGIGSSLFERVEAWAQAQGCRQIKVETQNVNVRACGFYARHGCELRAVRHVAYPELPEEIQLLWYKDQVETASQAVTPSTAYIRALGRWCQANTHVVRSSHMDHWFSIIAAGSELRADSVKELDDVGFVVVPGPVALPQLSRLAAVYDAAASAADPADVGGGRTTTRVWDFVNRAPDFDGLYVYQPILEACCRVIGAPFHLSTMHARAVNPSAPAQELHADYRRTTDGWPMVGFIFMVDAFRRDNGATRFVPGSHRWGHAPSDVMQDATADYEGQVSACGPAGAVVIYNGSVWHGHGVNQTKEPRRSVQGAYIRRDDKQGTNQAARMRPETLGRIGALARYVLNIESQLPVPDAHV